MTILFENETESSFDFNEIEIAERVIGEALRQEGFLCGCEVSLTLTDDEGIAALNKEFRAIDGPTDVLSFPMLDFPEAAPADYEVREEDTNPDTGDVMLGDIVISVPRMCAQADEYGHPVLREYAFLIAHSMLHLLGYDHMEEDERAVMEEKQEKILSALDIRR
ncbi:MAG: rRNA maturation RNase YbeY [Lachnospiraceae bacterium]|nr:rRNA maturation RNase YbeY [Lachnospiraceae bacterium]